MRDVAAELGILKGSLYHYIDSREDLIFRLFEAVHGDVEETSRPADHRRPLCGVALRGVIAAA